ncbi:MAG TPA: AI-2E family transporter [Dokdonella sp.]|mgnify:CR=1 FL=1|jgi:predicted PurR-regulated permease PerM|nr:AI-2E family transporter [Dokdonella sp.]
MLLPPSILPLRLAQASYLLAAVSLWLILELRLLPVLLAGLLVYALVNALAPSLQRHLPGTRAHWLVVALFAVIVVGLLTLAIAGGLAYLGSEHGNPAQLFERLTPVVERARAQLPAIIVDHLPDNSEQVRVAVMGWLREHAAQLQLAGKNAARVIVHLLIGMILGAMLALQTAMARDSAGPLTIVLNARCSNLVTSFHDIVFAQVKISALNTLFTAIFLLIVLPLFGVNLPLAKTLVVATFICGLLPVIGNLISNTLIFIIGLSVSLWVAIAALSFLIVIHKLEYFLNARIIGGQIRARAWELLIAMLVMEAAFGIAGVIAGPIYYAYLKRELEAGKLV